MVTDIYIIYNDDAQLEKLNKGVYALVTSAHFHFIKDTEKNKKDVWHIKNIFASKLSPFVGIFDKDTPIKAFYSEADNDVIGSLIKYLNDENTSTR